MFISEGRKPEDLIDAFNMGHDAAARGEDRSSNPFTQDDVRTEWFKGYEHLKTCQEVRKDFLRNDYWNSWYQ